MLLDTMGVTQPLGAIAEATDTPLVGAGKGWFVVHLIPHLARDRMRETKTETMR